MPIYLQKAATALQFVSPIIRSKTVSSWFNLYSLIPLTADSQQLVQTYHVNEKQGWNLSNNALLLSHMKCFEIVFRVAFDQGTKISIAVEDCSKFFWSKTKDIQSKV